MIYEIVMEIKSNLHGKYDTEPFDIEANNEEEAEYKAMIYVVKLIKPDPSAQTFTRTLKSIKQK